MFCGKERKILTTPRYTPYCRIGVMVSLSKKALAVGLGTTFVGGLATPIPTQAAPAALPEGFTPTIPSPDTPPTYPTHKAISTLKRTLPPDDVDAILATYQHGSGRHHDDDMARLTKQLAHLTTVVQHLVSMLDEHSLTSQQRADIATQLDLLADSLPHNTVTHQVKKITHAVATGDNDMVPDGNTSDDSPSTLPSDDDNDHTVIEDTSDSEDEAIEDEGEIRDIIENDVAITPVASVPISIGTSIPKKLAIMVLQHTPNSVILSAAKTLAHTGDPVADQAMMDAGYFMVRHKPQLIETIEKLPTVDVVTTSGDINAATLQLLRYLVDDSSSKPVMPKAKVKVEAMGREIFFEPTTGHSTTSVATQQAPSRTPAAKEAPRAALPNLVQPTSADARVKQVIDRVYAKIGTPYAWGGGQVVRDPITRQADYAPSLAVDGSGAVGYDCSGLMVYAFYKTLRNDKVDHPTGDPERDLIRLPRHSSMQYSSGGMHVPLNQMRPGDMLFYGSGGNDHVAMYVGNGKMVEAYDYGVGVVENPVRYSGICPFAVRVIY